MVETLWFCRLSDVCRVNSCVGICQDCGEFLEEVSCTWKHDFTSSIFLIVPMAS
jgi:hypothetical protein